MDVVSIAVAGGIGIVGTLLGTGVNYFLSTLRERKRDRFRTALVLANTERVIWRAGDYGAYAELRAQIDELDFRLSECGVDEAMRKAFATITRACWGDGRVSQERDLDNFGIENTLLDAREAVHRALRADLSKFGTKSERQHLESSAIEIVQSAVKDLTITT